jgi:hypothetical protein
LSEVQDQLKVRFRTFLAAPPHLSLHLSSLTRPAVAVDTVQQSRDHNATLVKKQVDLERDVDRIPGLKKQVETYKQAKCDAVR